MKKYILRLLKERCLHNKYLNSLYLMYRCAKRSKETSADTLKSYYSDDNPMIADNSRKLIIYCIDSTNLKFGLTDRLRAILSIYKICKEIGVDFKINYDTPYNLEDYLNPVYDWHIDSVSHNPEECEVISLHCLARGEVEVEAHNSFLTRRILSSKKPQIHIYSNTAIVLFRYPHEYKSLFYELFKPSEILIQKVKEHQENIGGDYINMTFRFQNLIGDFFEGKHITLETSEEKIKLMSCCKEQIVKMHNVYPNRVILVSSDSATFLSFVKDLKYVYIIEGENVHIAYADTSSFDLHLKSFVDFLMIVDAIEVFLLVGPRMYESRFPFNASRLGGKPFNTIKFNYVD